ncbi:MAG: SDR family oxidoreductase, partial [Sweet potato little leaf phytoplasma]|nr:SDR family oxidoreductase [Sweet potato little leaf phytoplasma]
TAAALGPACIPLPEDVATVAGCRALAEALGRREQRLDILVNNAGNDDRHTIEAVTPAYWDDRMAVNLRHLFFAAQAAVPSMRRAIARVIPSIAALAVW